MSDKDKAKALAKELAAKLKDDGLALAEEGATVVVKSLIGTLVSYLKDSKSQYDDLLIPLLLKAERALLEKAEGIHEEEVE